MRDKGKYRKHYGDDDDDDYKKRRYRHREPEKNALERILTPGVTANNIIKTAATGIIAASTVLLITIYGIAGDSLAGASYLPLATAAASAFGTACIWIFGRPKTEEIYQEEFTTLRKKLHHLQSNLDELESQNAELEDRLANVELLESFEDRLAKHTLDKQAKDQKTPPSSPISSKIPTTSSETSATSSPQQPEME